MVVLTFLWGDWCAPYGEEYVYRLKEAVDKHLSIPHRFVCLSDRDLDVETIRFTPNLRWNHNKLRMFADHGFEGRVLALDLDCVVTGSLDEYASYEGPFAVCESFNPSCKGLAGGSMVGFEAGTMGHLWEDLIRDYPYWDAHTCGSERMYYRKKVENPDLWQRLYPDTVYSWKRHCQDKVPETARIVFFHGDPRPHTRDWKL